MEGPSLHILNRDRTQGTHPGWIMVLKWVNPNEVTCT